MGTRVTVIGAGPGGYVAAVRAAQLGASVTIVEKEQVGGTCLNWGCIPTKSLLKSAQVFEYIQHASDYGIAVDGSVHPDFGKVIARSRSVAEGMSKGIEFLFKKNKIDWIKGWASIPAAGKVKVGDIERSCRSTISVSSASNASSTISWRSTPAC